MSNLRYNEVADIIGYNAKISIKNCSPSEETILEDCYNKFLMTDIYWVFLDINDIICCICEIF